jgi:signal transduction histidine kinase
LKGDPLKDKSRLYGFILVVVGIVLLWAINREIVMINDKQPDYYELDLMLVLLTAAFICTGLFMLVIGNRFYSVFKINSKITLLQVIFVASLISCWIFITNWRMSALSSIGYEKIFWPL